MDRVLTHQFHPPHFPCAPFFLAPLFPPFSPSSSDSHQTPPRLRWTIPWMNANRRAGPWTGESLREEGDPFVNLGIVFIPSLCRFILRSTFLEVYCTLHRCIDYAYYIYDWPPVHAYCNSLHHAVVRCNDVVRLRAQIAVMMAYARFHQLHSPYDS